MIKAIIFDMDGVLIDAKEWHYEALNRALQLFGHAIARQEHLGVFDGLPTRRKLEILSETKDLPQALHSFINRMKQNYTLELVHQHCKPRPQHEHALRTLKAQGYGLAVASNSIRKTVEIMMERSALIPYLDVMLSYEDVQRPKPNPDIYEKAFQILGVAPEEALVLEDNEYGIHAAQGAGAHVMVIETVDDVTLENIAARIARLSKMRA